MLSSEYLQRKLELILGALSDIVVGDPNDTSQQLIEDLRQSCSDLSEHELRGRLEGQGHIASMRAALGIPQPDGSMNLLTRWPLVERLTDTILRDLLSEFLPREWLGTDEGGDFRPNVNGLPAIPTAPEELSTGLYRLSEHWATLVLTQYDGHTIHHLMCPLHVGGYTTESYGPGVLTWCVAESGWIQHPYLQVLHHSKTRTTLKAWLTSYRFTPPLMIEESHFRQMILDRIEQEVQGRVRSIRQDGARVMEATIDHYHVSIIHHIGADGEATLALAVRSHIHDGARMIRWNELSPTKQQQFYAKFATPPRPSEKQA